MEVITGYFSSRDSAVEAAEYLRIKGFKGQISVLGKHNKEDDPDTDNRRSYTDNIIGINNFGGAEGASGGGIADFNAMMSSVGGLLVGSGFTGDTFGGNYSGNLTKIIARWGVPPRIGEEIRSVVSSGNSVILIECDEGEKSFIGNSLQYKGAQNIHL